MKLLVCDMDGVLFRGKNFWLDLHKSMGTAQFALDLWGRLGASDYRKLSELTARHWQGQSAQPYLELCNTRAVMPGADQLFSYAHSNRLQTAIISSGPWHLAQRAQAEWGVGHIFANRLGLTADKRWLTGGVEVQVDNNSKDLTLAALQKKLGIRPDETIVIGDSAADARMAVLSSCSIGYDIGKDVPVRSFDHLADRNLRNVMPYVQGCVIKAKVFMTH